MNILHLIDEPYDSGIVHYALTAACGLKSRGHAVLIGGLAQHPPLEQARALGLDTIPVRGFLAGILDLRALLKKRSLQIINAHTGSSHALAVAGTRFLRQAPLIVRTRADARPIRRNPARALVWSRTAGCIAPTRAILEQFHHAYPGSRVLARTVLPGLPDPHRMTEPPQPRSPAAQNGSMNIGMVGRLDPVKGHSDFLRSAAKILHDAPDARFLIAGREENTAARDLRAQASALGIADRVEFLGHLQDPLGFMRRCHVGVIASVASEAVSRVALEWMSQERPVVATRVGSLPELVQDAQTGFLVAPRDDDAMARRVLEIIKDRELRQAMGRRARERFDAHFTLARLAADTEGFYEELLHGIPSR